MIPLKAVLATAIFLTASACAFVYWPVWQEIRTRDADRAATLRTGQAVQRQGIDPAYLEIAKATGGSVCFAGGDTPEEKSRDLTQCMSAMEHRKLLETRDVRIRERYLKSKGLARDFVSWLYFPACLLTVFLARRRILNSRPLFALSCAAPPALFWVAMGGFPLLFESGHHLRDGLHLPLFGAAIAGALAGITHPLTSPAPAGTREKSWLLCLLVGMIPCGYIGLLLGAC